MFYPILNNQKENLKPCLQEILQSCSQTYYTTLFTAIFSCLYYKLNFALKMSYWDINQFLAEEEPITIAFKKDAECLDFLDPQKGFTEGVPQQEPVEIALWRSINLQKFCEEHDLLQMKVPKNYNKNNFFSYLLAFKQQSCPNPSKIQVLNLKSKSPYFYQVASLVQDIFQRQADFASVKQVADFFNQRASMITLKAISTSEWKQLDIHRKKLTNIQYEIYKQTFNKVISYNDWKASKKQQRLVQKKI